MKRIKAACLEQTIHFGLKEEVPHREAVRIVQAEVAHYLAQMDRNRTPYRVLEQTEQADGSVVMKVKKQYNSYDCTPYLEG